MIDILYVEDDENDADIFSRLVKKLDQPINYTILNSGSQALDYLSGKGQYEGQRLPLPKLLLLDLNLVGISGFDVLKWVRADARTRWLPIVAFSTSDNLTDIQHAYAAGANAYVVKPGSYFATGALLQGLCHFWVSANTCTDYQ